MKLTPLFALFAIALAVPTEKEESDAGLAIAGMPDGVSGAVVGPDGSFLTSTTQACGENSCHGFGGGDLCNDRCKNCGYARGSCCGTLWQTCCCYYS